MRRAVIQGRYMRISLLLLVIAILIAVASQSAAQSQTSATEFDRLALQAGPDGTVGVIVRLDVQGITALTLASTSVPTQAGSQDVTESRISADAALQEAIDQAANNLLTELQGTDVTVNSRYGSIPYLALRVSAGAIRRLQASPAVLGIEEDVMVGLIDPGEPSGGTNAADTDQPQLQNTVNIIGASTAWGWGYTGAGWYVAVLDTGIRKTHQFFTGKSIVEACFAKGADGVGGAGDCPNGTSRQTGLGSAAHYPSYYSGFDHGTHVSGIATGNYSSLAGVAKDANVVAVQVFSKMGGEVRSWNSDSLAGLDYVYSIRGIYNVASVNMSIGGGGPYSSPCDTDSRKAAIDNLRSAGIATPIATGNDGWCSGIAAPGCISTAVSVGASTDADVETGFNNWHPVLQKLFAPGASIYSSTGVSDSSYGSWSGTSMATPHVAGVWALMKQVLPSGSVTYFLDALRAQGLPILSICPGARAMVPRIRVDRAISTLVRYLLTIQSSQYGTTDPVPGAYYFGAGAQVQIRAIPEQYATFVDWTNGATGNANPVTVTMAQNKTVFANFRYIFPPSVVGLKQLNRSFSQAEYVNVLKWIPHSANQGLDISNYRIYRMNGTTGTILAEVPANAPTLEYLHRNAGLAEITYEIVAVTSGNREGQPAPVTVK